MEYIVDQKYPYGLKEFTELELDQLDLKLIYVISISEIEYDTDELKALFSVVNRECENSHVWVLLGSNDRMRWIPLQAASIRAGNVIKEIKSDFTCMIPFDENKDRRIWKSYFHGAVMSIDTGLNEICQKYRQIKKMCDYLAVAILTSEESLDNIDDTPISRYQKKECELACVLEPLLWNPFGKEHEYLRSIQSN